jgi:hypothetical protein
MPRFNSARCNYLRPTATCYLCLTCLALNKHSNGFANKK